MPQLLAVALIGGVIWYAWRALRREMGRVGDELERREQMKSASDVTKLERDPDGVYRPKQDD